ncbi:putative replication factor C large subunit [Yellowstone lake mimivirus]|uniref:putative replication factor C large subunit n=1 Tax=Yellowstone lake mimivirus TaxID=1586712 RepID=UPI0006EB75F1|nr:putative replication factor C large subunit [Yellowstone lake mimivirus]BAT22012.1 putative replication factor C large subunit [Yellowstone lake mimivirus]
MNQLNLNAILNREENVLFIKQTLAMFDQNKSNNSIKKGIYIYGEPGTGKTTFIINILKELDYDIIKYDAGDFRNKSIIDTISQHNMSDKNIMSLFHKKIKKIAIIMDEIDGMNNGDKGGINTLIKLIRPKKTKKQKLEEITMNPIICIGNYHIDKKIKELMKVCNTIELKTPTQEQINTIVKEIMPELDPLFIQYIQGDLKKLHNIWNIYQNKKDILQSEIIQNVFQLKTYNDDTKQIVQKIITQPFKIEEHNTIMNETDRTIIGLLWHENIIEVIDKMKPNVSIPFYIKQLDNICFADYIDRITFQKQIWQFNEMSSLIKTFKNNHLYHSSFKKKRKFNIADVRFTKVLTKFSTEYNNTLFIQNLCQQLAMDKKDVFAFFLDLKSKYNENELVVYLENYEITKLDINRIYRYINKYTNDNIADNVEIEIDTSDEED